MSGLRLGAGERETETLQGVKSWPTPAPLQAPASGPGVSSEGGLFGPGLRPALLPYLPGLSDSEAWNSFKPADAVRVGGSPLPSRVAQGSPQFLDPEGRQELATRWLTASPVSLFAQV